MKTLFVLSPLMSIWIRTDMEWLSISSIWTTVSLNVCSTVSSPRSYWHSGALEHDL